MFGGLIAAADRATYSSPLLGSQRRPLRRVARYASVFDVSVEVVSANAPFHLRCVLYDFIVGDYPVIALSIAVAIAATAALTAAGINASWLLPAALAGARALCRVRATKR